MVRPIPVFPAVPSSIVAPSRRSPRASASSIIPRAARSFTEPPGFMNSALPRISQPVSSDTRRRRRSGVRPMWPSTPTYDPGRRWLPPRLSMDGRTSVVKCVLMFGLAAAKRRRLRVIGLRGVAEVGLHFPHPPGKHPGPILVRDGGHNDAILAIVPVSGRRQLVIGRELERGNDPQDLGKVAARAGGISQGQLDFLIRPDDEY